MTYAEYLQEAERLTRVLRRRVEVVPRSCDCNYWDYCPKCSGRMLYHELVYSFCGHKVQDDPRNEDDCRDNECEHKEYKAFCERTNKTEAA